MKGPKPRHFPTEMPCPKAAEPMNPLAVALSKLGTVCGSNPSPCAKRSSPE
ncbi:hypothetical protein [Meiothermus rufus]|uniref:hypothetical protein n=1 Tax=Meiothermus rufus TaxID=604332 RepID=UPI00041DF9C0|nr:hypothetical protein [Meiothermus rufus]